MKISMKCSPSCLHCKQEQLLFDEHEKYRKTRLLISFHGKLSIMLKKLCAVVLTLPLFTALIGTANYFCQCDVKSYKCKFYFVILVATYTRAFWISLYSSG